MKRILSSLVMAVALMGAVHASETSISTQSDLTDAQKASLAATAAKMVADNANNPTVAKAIEAAASPDKAADTVKKWADIGTAIGSGLASSAKQLGVAANDFAQTGVGKFTMLIIAWHFIGAPLVHIVFGSLWLFFTISLWIYFYRRASSSVTVTVYETGKGPSGASKVTVRAPQQLGKTNDDRTAVGAIYVVSLAVLLIIGIITVFSF